MSIYFYGYRRPNGEFSNFYPCEFKEEGLKFNCNEQYFMFHKVLEFEPENNELIDMIMNETRPSFIKRYGGKKYLKTFDYKRWNKKRYNVMLEGLRLKFSQNEELKKKLLSTGEKLLYEASYRDKIWGIGFGIKQAPNIPVEKYGQNLLGKALMLVRLELQQNMIK